MTKKQFFIYIMTNKRKGTLYIGVTSDLPARVWQHKSNLIEGFTEKYKLHKLVYYEQHENIYSAIKREKQMKKWQRQWKLEIVEKLNPHWKDLYEEII